MKNKAQEGQGEKDWRKHFELPFKYFEGSIKDAKGRIVLRLPMAFSIALLPGELRGVLDVIGEEIENCFNKTT